MNENVSFNSSQNQTIDENDLLFHVLGSRYRSRVETIILTIFYCAIFITGLVGNLCTCVVIIKNGYMHTATNYYLFSLAVSDLLTLILGLPPELYSIWEAYPWRFGEPYCQFKSFITEMTSTASVLTITSFTVERYVAICHPIKAQTMSNLSRAVKIIFIIWVMAAVMVLPVPLHVKTFYAVTDPYAIKTSLICTVPPDGRMKYRMNYYFAFSTIVLFIFPMSVITALYIKIGVTLRRPRLVRQCSDASGSPPQAHARRGVLKMLVAVVVAFFICWAPFHAQRLMTVFLDKEEWTDTLLEIQSVLFYISGVLWFVSSTVNPILYNLMSRKYRQAFKHTLCRCCTPNQNVGRFPPTVMRFTSDRSPTQTYVTTLGATRILHDKHLQTKSPTGDSPHCIVTSARNQTSCGRWTNRLGRLGDRCQRNRLGKGRANGNACTERSPKLFRSSVGQSFEKYTKDIIRDEEALVPLNRDHQRPNQNHRQMEIKEVSQLVESSGQNRELKAEGTFV